MDRVERAFEKTDHPVRHVCPVTRDVRKDYMEYIHFTRNAKHQLVVAQPLCVRIVVTLPSAASDTQTQVRHNKQEVFIDIVQLNTGTPDDVDHLIELLTVVASGDYEWDVNIIDHWLREDTPFYTAWFVYEPTLKMVEQLIDTFAECVKVSASLPTFPLWYDTTEQKKALAAFVDKGQKKACATRLELIQVHNDASMQRWPLF